MTIETVRQHGRLAIAADPYALFGTWMTEAEASEPNDANAMSLATIDADGMPSVRIVLLKGLDPQGFVFYTNMESRKGLALAANARAGLCFHWKSLRRQVRVEGAIEQVTGDEADAYYASRARGSRIGAWASEQSRPLESRQALLDAVAAVDRQYPGDDVPRPPHWSGFRVRPARIEFWIDGEFRLHDRAEYLPDGNGGWHATPLYP